MDAIQKCLEDRARAKSEGDEILETAKSENRDLTPDELSEAKEKFDEVERLTERINHLQRAEEVAKQRLRVQEAVDTPPVTQQVGSPAPQSITGNRIDIGHDLREDDPSFGWNSLGEFALGVYNSFAPGHVVDERLRIGAAVSGMSQGIGSEGGWTVPPTFSTTIWDGLNNRSDSLLPLTDTFEVTGESLTFIANAETSRATGSRWGGIRAYWLAEADQMTKSKPKVRKLTLEPQMLGVYVLVTDKLLKNNQSALDSYLSRAATDEIAFLVNDAIINGSGAGMPQGILNSGAVVSVAKETNQPAATVVTENVLKMHARLHIRARTGAMWLINQDVEPQLHKMTIAVGASGLPVYLPPGNNLSASPQSTLLGLPVMPIEYCATLGTVGDILLVNLNFYATGTRGGVDSASSIHLRFDYNETAFRFLFEIDGRSWLNSALTPFKGSNTVSPFISLATRA